MDLTITKGNRRCLEFRAEQPCRGPSRREILRVGSLGFLGLGLDDWFRLRALAGPSVEAATAKAKNCILIWLAGGPSHLDTFDPKPEAPGRRPGRVQADRHVGPGPADQRGVSQPGQGHGPGHADPEHDLARVRPRPGRAPPADRLSPVAGPGLSGLWQRGGQGARGDARDAAAVMSPSPTRRSSASSGYLTPGLRPVRRLGRPELRRASGSGT